MRPHIVGEALSRIRENPEVADVLFRLLELQATLKIGGKITLTAKEGTGTAVLLNC